MTKKQYAEKTINEYLKPVFGFALKRCRNVQDAEDLSQEIILRAYKAIISRNDIADVGKFIWTIAHNALSNYYRDGAKGVLGVPIDEFADIIEDPNVKVDIENDDDAKTIQRMQTEIAYLSKLQRKIVIEYYYRNRKQADIANELGIPVGTVKWHLFEAKKELKRGMDTMRKTSELKFNPVKLKKINVAGSIGTKECSEYLRSALAQNICYCVRDVAKTVNEIADDIGVSPVYVEGEAEYLEKYGYLSNKNDKYLLNFIISEPTEELMIMEDNMYKKAAELYANDLYDELINSGIVDDSDIICNQTDEPVTFTSGKRADRNFILWSLIPYITSGIKEGMEAYESIKFSEVATRRADGAYNIVEASVFPEKMTLPDDYVKMNNWCGPMWNTYVGNVLWQIDSEWSDRGDTQWVQYFDDAKRVLSLYNRDDELSEDECTWLAERGYVKVCEKDGCVKCSWQIVSFANKDIQDRLLEIGNRIKDKYKDDFDALKTPYIDAVLKTIPSHMAKAAQFKLQYTFKNDGMFILHCIVALLKNGKLKPPTEGQKKALSTLIAFR